MFSWYIIIHIEYSVTEFFMTGINLSFGYPILYTFETCICSFFTSLYLLLSIDLK